MAAHQHDQIIPLKYVDKYSNHTVSDRSFLPAYIFAHNIQLEDGLGGMYINTVIISDYRCSRQVK